MRDFVRNNNKRDGVAIPLGSSVFMLPVHQRSDSFKPLKEVYEMADVQIPQFCADLGDALIALTQLHLGKLYLLPVDVVGETFAHLPVEQSGEITGA